MSEDRRLLLQVKSTKSNVVLQDKIRKDSQIHELVQVSVPKLGVRNVASILIRCERVNQIGLDITNTADIEHRVGTDRRTNPQGSND